MLTWIGQIIAGGFTSWKTTLTAIVSALAVLLAQAGIVTIDQETQLSIVVVAMFIIGWFSKDTTQTGRPLDED